MAKNFADSIVTRPNTLIDTMEQATAERKQQGTASTQEQEERIESFKTQGRKGCKAPRINVAFTNTNHEFVKVVASVTGQSMTQFINFVIDTYRQEHPEVYEKAKAVKDIL